MHEEQTDQTNNQPGTSDKVFPVVGIGASAGGLDAFERFFQNLPHDTGMAYVIVQHLDPDHKSMLHEIVQRYTMLPVAQATHEMEIEQDHVYIIPPNRDMALKDNKLILTQPEKPRGFRLPIDFFFRSLADERQANAVGIVLSGTASDGTLGIKEIKGAGGMTMAQEPSTARYYGMPDNAIATGLVDFILPPEEMPAHLTAYVEQVLRSHQSAHVDFPAQSVDLLQEIFDLLHEQTGHDFSYYKPSTVSRRIERRMAVCRRDTLPAYVKYLKQNTLEIEILFKELLIGVTRFFRDEEAFSYLRQQVIPELINKKHDNEPLRVWVPGCSTGEEAYSIAMLLYDACANAQTPIEIQVFATDIDYEAVESARAAVYPGNIVADVLPTLIQKHFQKDDGHYRVRKHIRDIVVFAEQSLIKDPPFSRLDLISCRNLLIYLEIELQKKVIQLFHYALEPEGYLFLGTSESLAGFDQLFEAIEKKWKIYRRLNAEIPRASINVGGGLEPIINSARTRRIKSVPSIQDIAREAILARFPYPAVIINEKAEILYFHGNTAEYLRPPTGEASFNILNMAHDKLRPALRDGLHQVYSRRQEVTKEIVRLTVDDRLHSVRVILQPVKQQASPDLLTLVIFEEASILETAFDPDESPEPPLDDKDQRILKLQQELRSTREYLQTIVEELETSNEELSSANEELQSSNEEFQSTNEELETTKEELQSVNEELITVNAELNDKIDALSEVNTHQRNLLNNMNSGLVFLNEGLGIQLFNPIAGELLNLLDQDIGRPVHHFAANFRYSEFKEDCEQVLNTLKSVKHEIQSVDGRWFVIEIQPYRTLEGDVAGLVVTFIEISDQKEMQTDITRQRQLYRTLAAHLPNTVAFLFDHEMRYVVADGQGLEAFGLAPSEIEGKYLKDVILFSENQKLLTQLSQDTLQGQFLRSEITRNNITFLIQTAPVYDEHGKVVYGLLIGLDISERRQMELELQRNEEIYRTLVQHWPDQAIFVFDKNLRYIFAGGEALLEAGYAGEELIGHSLSEVLLPERVEMFKPHYEAALRGERVEFPSDIGGRRYHNRAIPIERDDGVILAGMIITTEINNE